jgi:hypothetical protein
LVRDLSSEDQFPIPIESVEGIKPIDVGILAGGENP